MKFASYKLNDLFDLITNKKLASHLIYGENQGLVAELQNRIIQTLKKNNSGWEVENFNCDTLESDPSILTNNAFNIGLFGEKKVLIIKHATNKITQTLQQIITSQSFDSNSVCIIITAEELDTKSSLRMLFEKEENVSSIACYSDDIRSLTALINEFFQKNQIETDAEVTSLIINSCNSSRVEINAALNQLSLFLGDKKIFKLEEARKIFNNLSQFEIDEIIDAALNANLKLATKGLRYLIEDEQNLITLIRAMIYRISQLEKMQTEITNGSNIEIQIQKERIFFKKTSSYKNHLSKFSLKTLSKISSFLATLEIEIKKHSNSIEIQEWLVYDLFYKISKITNRA